MRRTISSVMLALCVAFTFYNCEYRDDLVGNWKGPSQVNTNGRGGATCFVIDDKAYLVGGRGYIKSEAYFLDTWQFDPESNSWKQFASVPAEKGRSYGVGFAAKGSDGKTKGYYGTGVGKSNEMFRDFYEFDPEANSDAEIPGEWTITDSLPVAGNEGIYGMVGFSIDGVGYIGAGQTKNLGYANTFYRYDPNAAEGEKWKIVEHINPAKRCHGSVFVIDNRAYIVGGISNGNYVRTLERFDPSYEKGEYRWYKITQDFAEDYRSTDYSKVYREQAAAFTINGRGYLCCGRYGGAKSDVWEYIPFAGRDNMGVWTEVCSFEGPQRYGCVGFSTSKGVGYVGTGMIGTGQGQFYDDVWEFHPQEDYDKHQQY